MTASITPNFANSILLVNFEFGLLLRAGGAGAAVGYGVKRNGTRIVTAASNTHEGFVTDDLMGTRKHYTYVDTTHNSTSQQTYLLEAFLRSGYSDQIVEFSTRDIVSNVVIYEVAA
jgi:hypothetical protein